MGQVLRGTGRGKGLGAPDTRVWGWGLIILPKGLTSLKKKKKSPPSPRHSPDPHGRRTVRGEGARVFSEGYRPLPSVSPLLANLPHVPSFLVQLLKITTIMTSLYKHVILIPQVNKQRGTRGGRAS